MSPAQKSQAKPSVRDDTRQHQENERLLSRISESLEVAQADLGKLRGSVGKGVNDLRRDVSRLLRDARRDVTKMAKASRKDLERLQKDMVAAATAKANGGGARRARTATASKPRGVKTTTRSKGRPR